MSGDEHDAIRLEGVSKIYRIPVKGRATLRGTWALLGDALRGRITDRRDLFRPFVAVQPLDLRIGRGESVAIVGRNGSGKSTLLEMISGTLQPSSGTVTVNGRVSALLQLGSGFNPEFTGLENIFLNGAILGVGRARMQEKLDDILAFADIGDFVTQPVKTYSSGMRLRLAFAVITAVDPDILIIDEALSVGDAFFQSRCVRWLEQFVRKGRTFLCVSHDMFLVQRLCRRGLVMDAGRVVCDAEVSEAANRYYRLHRKELPAAVASAAGSPSAGGSAAGEGWCPLTLQVRERTGNGRLTIERVRTRPGLDTERRVGEWLEVEVEVLAHEAVEGFHFGFGFRDRSGQLIGGYHSFYRNETFRIEAAGARRWLRFAVRLDLKPQEYLLLIGLAINHTVEDWLDLDCLWDCARVVVNGPEPFWGLTALPVRNVAFLEKP